MPTHSRKTILLATDQQRSVLNALDEIRPHPIAYTPYGHRPRENGVLSRLGFNGERPDPVTGHYHLGNGYRQFNPVLMRFNSPDSWSPFGAGGLNAHGYCGGDPTNSVDPGGHAPQVLLAIRNFFRANRRSLTVEPGPVSPTSQTTRTSMSPLQTVRPSYRNPLANVAVNTDIAAQPIPPSIDAAGTVSRALYPPSYLQRPDSPPPIYRSSPLSRVPNTSKELPPPYETAAQDSLFEIRVITIRAGEFRRKAQLSVHLIRN
jgi:RHS repeat-associated protein